MHKMYKKMLDYEMCQEDLISAGWFDDKGFKGKMTLGISGGFSPVHIGHISALSLAKEYFEKQGYYVEAVLFPAHASYAQPKSGMSSHERYSQINDFLIKNYITWIKIDAEPMFLYQNEVNFPWLIDRLKYLAGHGETAFVFGEDNAQFALSFIDSEHHAVIVERAGGGMEALKEKMEKYNVAGRIKWHYLKDNPNKDESSTRIRLLNKG